MSNQNLLWTHSQQNAYHGGEHVTSASSNKGSKQRQVIVILITAATMKVFVPASDEPPLEVSGGGLIGADQQTNTDSNAKANTKTNPHAYSHSSIEP